ncbi:hypothetical protein DVH05_025118 [Phytophthora capsici]|nr:hypothetical protein DVH05_025118 [Phytophthora capsici]
MSRGDNQLPSVCFDDDCQVRVLDKENITHTQELEQESNQFATKLEEFHDIVKGVLEVMEGQAKRIEREKLKWQKQRRQSVNGTASIARWRIEIDRSRCWSY